MKHGGERRSHSSKCRDRMMKAMNEDEEDRERIKRREEEINEKIARQMEKTIREDKAKEEESTPRSKTDKGGAKGGENSHHGGDHGGDPHRRTREVWRAKKMNNTRGREKRMRRRRKPGSQIKETWQKKMKRR